MLAKLSRQSFYDFRGNVALGHFPPIGYGWAAYWYLHPVTIGSCANCSTGQAGARPAAVINHCHRHRQHPPNPYAADDASTGFSPYPRNSPAAAIIAATTRA